MELPCGPGLIGWLEGVGGRLASPATLNSVGLTFSPGEPAQQSQTGIRHDTKRACLGNTELLHKVQEVCRKFAKKLSQAKLVDTLLRKLGTDGQGGP